MRNLRFVSLTVVFFLAACNEPERADKANFTAAIDRWLERHGQLCSLISVQFPLDIPRSRQSEFDEKLSALQHAGVLSETDIVAVVHGLMDALRGSTPPQPVRHYTVTAEGQRYVQPVSGTVIPAVNFCYGQKTVDSIIHWNAGSSTSTEVTYTYRIADVAPWAQRLDIQQAFPDIRSSLEGASKTEQVIVLQHGDSGWQVP